MKTKKVNQKLTLKKNTIDNLNLEEMLVSKGGYTCDGDITIFLSRIRPTCGRVELIKH